MRRRKPWRVWWVGLVASGVVVTGGCVGTTDRDEFDEIIQQRGGGFTPELPLEAVEVVADELGVEDIELRGMTVTPSSELVSLDVRDPAVPANLDTYTVRRGEIDSVEPVRLSADDELGAQVFPASGLALDRLDEMVDTALAEFDPQGYVTSLSVSSSGGGDATFLMSLESPRASASARFTGAGDLVEVVRS